MLLDALACAGSLALFTATIYAVARAYEAAQAPEGFIARLKEANEKLAEKVVVIGAVLLAVSCAAAYGAVIYTFVRLVRAIITA